MASAALGESVFHGTPSLVTERLESDGSLKALPRTLKAIVGIVLSGGSTEKIAHYASTLPPGDRFGGFLTKIMVNTLWGSLLHPPLSYKGNQSQYRTADGSNNSTIFPDLGKAGLPYAKTVPGVSAMPGARPDPGDLFDLLMAREDQDDIKESDLGISSMLVYHADLIIHDIFRTNNDDKNISDTSSYLDLTPLYGRSREHQETVRLMKDGLLKPDSFAEDRLLNQPPGVVVYLVMYNRFHNYVAKQLKEINERGKFSRVKRAGGWFVPAKAGKKPDETDDRDNILEEVSKIQGLRSVRRPRNWNPPDMLLEPIAWDIASSADASLDRSTWTYTPSAELLDEAWRRGLDSLAHKEVPPTGWLPASEPRLLNQRLDEAWEKYLDVKIDEDLFQTARLVTCGLYIQVAIHDYLRVLMRKHAENTSWTMDPRIDMSWAMNKKGIERGIGNQVTVEFNALYRFHSPLSKRDAEWTRRFLKHNVPPRYMPGQSDPNALTQEEYDHAVINVQIMREMLWKIQREGGSLADKKAAPYVPAKTFDFKRGPDGKFDDKQLVQEICNVMEDPLCPFGARNVPKFFRSIEILGILQARKWELSTLNEFREFFGMKRHKTFADINTDPQIQDRLCTLYEHPDMVELHPGLWCEGQGRILDPGTSCPNGQGTALWRGVFSDAVTLVRSDRFYTLDWNVESLTSWGMSEVATDLKIFKGGVMARLFQRAFPGYFENDSIHLWQPFYTPAMNILVAHDQDLLSELQDIKQLGVSDELWKDVLALKDRNDLLHKKLELEFPNFKDADLKDLKDIQAQIMKDFGQVGWFKRMTTQRRPDGKPLWRKAQFKLLRDVAKMTVQKKQSPTPVSNPEVIRMMLSGDFKTQFKNPGYADATAFRGKPLTWLEELLRGEKIERDGRKLKGGSGDLQDVGIDLLQKKVSKAVSVYPAYYMSHSLRPNCTANCHDGDHDHDVHDPEMKKHGIAELTKPVKRNVEDMFYDYFFIMAHKIRHREQLKYQKIRVSESTANGTSKTKESGTNAWTANAQIPVQNGSSKAGEDSKGDKFMQVYQLDFIKDYAIPVITRFLADFLGFGHLIKTKKFPSRPYEENEIYEHFINCQDYLTFDADDTRAFRRRKAFQTSLKFLKDLTEEAVEDAQRMWFEGVRGRTYHTTDGDNELVRELRKFGVSSAQDLTAYFTKEKYENPKEAAAAVLLGAALDASHKSVMMFTEVLQCLLKSYRVEDQKGEEVYQRVLWQDIQRLSRSNNPEDKKTIMKYVLEAQRASFNFPLVRKFQRDRSAVGPSAVTGDALSLSEGNTAALEDNKSYILELVSHNLPALIQRLH